MCYRVITEQRNIALIASVQENGSSIWVPVLVCYKIPLLVSVLVDKTKMVNLQDVRHFFFFFNSISIHAYQYTWGFFHEYKQIISGACIIIEYTIIHVLQEK